MATTPRFIKDDNWPCAIAPAVFENFADNLDVNQQQTLQRFLMLQAKGAEQSRDTIRQLSQQLAQQHTPHPDALRDGLACLLEVDMRQALADLSCPVQLILGDRDTLIPSTMPEQAAKLNPALQLTMLEGAGHAPFITQPDQCQHRVEQFIHG